MQKTVVYLAGGMRTEWQDRVKSEVPDLIYYDPRLKGSQKLSERMLTLAEYGTWDLTRIKQSDVVFAYMERTNPGGAGMAVEIGYAKGLGKTVILCLESDNEHQLDRYLDFLKKVADVVYTDFKEAVEGLKLYQ